MMGAFSAASEAKLRTCDPRLQAVMREVVKHFDCTILEGHRDQAAQELAFSSGHSQLYWPHGRHNAIPSNAVDVAPFPVDWSDTQRFYYFAGFVMGTAQAMGIHLRYGGDWNSNTMLHDQTLMDLVHFELSPTP